MMTVEQLAEKLENIESSRLHLKDKVATLETKIDSLQGAVDDINEIKKTLNELVSELRGGKDNELRHHDPLFTEVAKNTALRERAVQTDLFSEVKKNTEFRQRSQWTMNLLIGINTLFTSGIVGLVVMMFINYYASK